jgi:serine/threonine-protein kinase
VPGTKLKLTSEWTLGDRLGGGGFGQVFLVEGPSGPAAAKLIPKSPGADRELLFADIGDARNVVPIIDSGEYGDAWVIVMPLASGSLRDHLKAAGGRLPLSEVVAVLTDVCTALVDLDGRVVHRDLKPENVLLLGGRWCLADFGISRYAEATTAPDTHKYALTPPYAAPERWRDERATAPTDIYSVGVMAFEMLEGRRPFPGPATHDYREQHLHITAPAITDAPSAMDALVAECLYKPASARPPAANVLARLATIPNATGSPGLGELEKANRDAVHRISDAAGQQSRARSEQERRAELLDVAGQSWSRISDALREPLVAAAPAAQFSTTTDRGWTLRLGPATLRMVAPTAPRVGLSWGDRLTPNFEVVAASRIELDVKGQGINYEGRSHSLWFGDVQREDEYAWFETSFMFSPLLRRSARQEPFALDPGEEAAQAVGPGVNMYAVAWPFTRLVLGDLGEVVNRWAGWFAQAFDGRLAYPSTMPERDPAGTWRK